MTVFISCSQNDAPIAKHLADALRARGLSPWVDREMIHAGANWVDAVEDALRKADAFVLVIGPDAAHRASENQRREWRAALETTWDDPHKPVIPVLLEGAELPAFLQDRPALRLDSRLDGKTAALDKLAELLRNGSAAPRVKVPQRAVAERRARLDDLQTQAYTLRDQAETILTTTTRTESGGGV